MAGAALLFLTGVQPDTPYAAFWYWLMLMGLGIGLIMSPMTTAIMGTVPPARAGMASATSNTMRQVGSVFGIAVLGNIVTHVFTSELRVALAEFKLPPRSPRSILAVAGAGQRGRHRPARPRRGHGGARPGHRAVVHQRRPPGVWISGILLLRRADRLR